MPVSDTHKAWRILENDYNALHLVGAPQKLTHRIHLASIIRIPANRFLDLKYCSGFSSADTLETTFHAKLNV